MGKDKVLNVIYDLKYGPVTFDFLVFLSLAECYRKLFGYERIHFYFDLRYARKRSDREKLMLQTERQRRVDNILLGSIKLLPRVSSVHYVVRVDDEFMVPEKDVFPPDYFQADSIKNWVSPYFPRYLTQFHKRHINVQNLIPSLHHQEQVSAKYIKAGFYTLSIRKCKFFSERDTDLCVWYSFYKYLKKLGLCVVVIPDQDDLLTDKIYKNYDWNDDINEYAAFDISYRLALYLCAIHNFAMSGGPTFLLWLSKANFSYFIMINEMLNSSQLGFIERSTGVKKDQQMPWFSHKQRLLWEDPTVEKLISEYDLLNTVG